MTQPIEPTEGFEELPEPTAGPSRRRLAVFGLVVAGGLAAGGAFALVSAAGAASTSGSASSAPTSGSTSSAASCAPGTPGGPHGTPPKLAAGDFDGTITAVNSSSITVKSHDGTSRTYAITSKTTVHSGPGTTAKVSTLKKAEHVHIRGSKSGSTYTATDIGLPPKGGPAGGPPNGGPGGPGRGPGHGPGNGKAPSGAPSRPSAPTPSASTSS